MAAIDRLNEDVSSAILLAEKLSDSKVLDEAYVRIAWSLLSSAQLHLAKALPHGCSQWIIACQGAVRAVVRSGDQEKAKEILECLRDDLRAPRDFFQHLRSMTDL